MTRYELWRRTGQGPWRSIDVSTRKDLLSLHARREVREMTQRGKVVGFWLGKLGDMPEASTPPMWEVDLEDRGDSPTGGVDH